MVTHESRTQPSQPRWRSPIAPRYRPRTWQLQPRWFAPASQRFAGTHRSLANTPQPLPDKPPTLPNTLQPPPLSEKPPAAPLSHQGCTRDEIEAKNLDVVLWGATGYTGSTAARYLAKGHTERPRWAIAGRNQTKLETFAKKLGSMESPPTLVYGNLNETALIMAKQAKVIINFAGPFEKYGAETIIKAALQGCAHYVDISTETHWNAMMLKKYESKARKRGIAIVQSAGFSSLASDLLAMIAMREAVSLDKYTPKSVVVTWKTYNAARSRGERETEMHKQNQHGRLNDAYILSPDIPSDYKIDSNVDGMKSYASKNSSYFRLSQHDCPVIRRSMYTEFANPISVKENAHPLLKVKAAEFNQFAKRFPVSFAGMAMASAISKQDNQTHDVHVHLWGIGAPNSIATGKMATEMALGLAFHGPSGREGGYLTPALALGGDILENRLSLVDDGKLVNITHDHP